MQAGQHNSSSNSSTNISSSNSSTNISSCGSPRLCSRMQQHSTGTAAPAAAHSRAPPRLVQAAAGRVRQQHKQQQRRLHTAAAYRTEVYGAQVRCSLRSRQLEYNSRSSSYRSLPQQQQQQQQRANLGSQAAVGWACQRLLTSRCSVTCQRLRRRASHQNPQRRQQQLQKRLLHLLFLLLLLLEVLPARRRLLTVVLLPRR